MPARAYLAVVPSVERKIMKNY